MSLKTDYGLASALHTAFVAGQTYIGTALAPGVAYASLQSALVAAAAQGKTQFTVTVSVTHAPGTLRLSGKYYETFCDGVYSALAIEDIYSSEVTVALNTTDNITTSIDFVFDF
jgi:hypothetical protein